MLISVELLNIDVDEAFDNLLKGTDLATKHYMLTYKTANENIKTGDLVVVNVDHRRSGYAENAIAIVKKVLTDKTEKDFEFKIKPVLATMAYDQAITDAQNEKRKADLMQKMEERAEKLTKIEQMKKLAGDDKEMQSMIKQYEELSK